LSSFFQRLARTVQSETLSTSSSSVQPVGQQAQRPAGLPGAEQLSASSCALGGHQSTSQVSYFLKAGGSASAPSLEDKLF
jgi:hypothetical protein